MSRLRPVRTRSRAAASRLLAAACAVCACGHAPVPRATLPAPVWPLPPAAPRVRFEGVFPDESAPPAAASPAWRRVLSAIVGADEEAPRRAPRVLARPFGVAAVAGGFLVADPDGRSVQRVDLGRAAARPIRCSGRPWVSPMAVAIGPGGTVYVADAGAAVVVRIAGDGACAPLGGGRLQRPVSLAVDGSRLYVADPPAHAVVVLDPDGREVQRLGGRGAGEGQLHFPTGLALAPDDTLLVVDALNFRVARFNRDGRWLSSFGGAGDGEGAFGRPKSVAVDGSGRVYVSDAQNDVIVVTAADGAFDLAVGGSGAGAGELALPAGVSVGGDGRLFVADSGNHRVAIFRILAEGAGTP